MAESVHLMGAGGIGMAAVAELLVRQGKQVSGCDTKPSAVLDRLAGLGVATHIGHSPEHLAGVDRLVYSSAVPATNPELAAARGAGLVLQHRSEALAEVASNMRVVAVAGTHGKTTTSAMAVAALEAAGFDVSYAIGSELMGRPSGAKLADAAAAAQNRAATETGGSGTEGSAAGPDLSAGPDLDPAESSPAAG
ncbi:MAG: Mur ligase domain-containing protein, partial [Bifidobacteriaceae bacterium]|nr:Mur ligase domain-containing protein [Bifidobacteriaceae bacterium]